MGWKALKYVFVASGGPTHSIQLVAIIPAEVILGYVDLLSERYKNLSVIADLKQVDAERFPLFYEPSTIKDWYALVNLCQRLAAADSIRQAPVGREYVRVKIGDSVVRIRVSRTIAADEQHRNQQMYYVSYEGEWNAAHRTIAARGVDHSFMALGAPLPPTNPRVAALPPTYPMVAQFLLDHPVGNDAQRMRQLLKGLSDSTRTDLKTATVAAFLAEGARNVRAIPINLILLDLVEHAAPYTTAGGRERLFAMDRMFWRRHQYSARPAAQTVGGHMPQSGAGGADVKKVKMVEPPLGPAEWRHRTAFAPHAAQPDPNLHLGTLQNPVFTPSGTFAQARASLTNMARPALDKECGVACTWLAYKFNLIAEEQPPNMVMASVRFLSITDLNHITLPPPPLEEVAQVPSLLRRLEIIKGALSDRCHSLDDQLATREDFS